MRKQAVLIVGAVVALLAAFGVIITPEQHEAIEIIVVALVPILGALYARSQVASKDTVEKTLGADAEAQVFSRGRMR